MPRLLSSHQLYQGYYPRIKYTKVVIPASINQGYCPRINYTKVIILASTITRLLSSHQLQQGYYPPINYILVIILPLIISWLLSSFHPKKT